MPSMIAYKERTLSRNEESMQLERHERVRKISEELLQQCRKLDRVVLGEVDGRCVPINRFSQFPQPTNVAIPAEDALDRHV